MTVSDILTITGEIQDFIFKEQQKKTKLFS